MLYLIKTVHKSSIQYLEYFIFINISLSKTNYLFLSVNKSQVSIFLIKSRLEIHLVLFKYTNTHFNKLCKGIAETQGILLIRP